MTSARAHDEDSLSTALWVLVAHTGHHRCAGWTFEERDELLKCACGTPLYQLRMINQEASEDDPR
ncbi:hypothetical protein Drose_31935 [Dactylosporangium roseum]|uniref:Uncharacterized protein n=1 Tax=Dactylosporangium roseum TaxID=47989 RepID=A0ABY5Z1J5_9ACTN|nr:hypothetical protein [Dactylosporangium roseum]UWZ35672.1 hypothetical protein Drose_31935 [Dactylosporangium roseum]